MLETQCAHAHMLRKHLGKYFHRNIVGVEIYISYSFYHDTVSVCGSMYEINSPLLVPECGLGNSTKGIRFVVQDSGMRLC